MGFLRRKEGSFFALAEKSWKNWGLRPIYKLRNLKGYVLDA